MFGKVALQWIVLIAILIIVPGCVNGSPATNEAPFCDLYQPVYLTLDEQDALADVVLRDIDKNNAAWLELCE